jgi:ankyrin repeat protein
MTALTATTDLMAYNFNLETTDFLSPLNALLIGQTFLHELAREGDILTAEIVLGEEKADINLPDDQGRHPLHEAALFGRTEMAGFLLDSGAEIDAPIHPFGQTALYLAVERGHMDVVRLLIERGSSLKVEDTLLGHGLLHLAASRGDMRMTGLLIASGIDVFREDKKGMTPRDHAARAGHRELEKSLTKVMVHQARF